MTASATTDRSTRVTWVSTTQHAHWVTEPAPLLEESTITSMADFPNVILNSETRHQVIDGFGACFNELGWTALAVVRA